MMITWKDELINLAKSKEYVKLLKKFECMKEVDIAEILEDLKAEQTFYIFHMLNKDTLSEVFSYLSVEKQQEIILSLNDEELKQIIEELGMDDTADMVEELPANVVKRILTITTKEKRDLINQYLKYEENTAGTVMTVEYVDIKKSMNVAQALEHIRRTGNESYIYTCYVTDETRTLEGTVTLRKLVMSSGERLVSELIDSNVIYASTYTDREETAKLIGRYDLLSLPVVDKEKRLVGVITVDDVLDVLNEETTEDMEIMAALSPSEKPYLKTGVFELAGKRIIWLLLLMVSSMLTGGVLEKYENAFAVVPLLVTFIPMLMDTGGNAGSQSSTLIIRGLTLGNIVPKQIFSVLWKEIRVSAICGSCLALVNFIRLIIMYPGNLLICLTVILSLFATVVMAKTIGCMLPIAASKLKLDPAIMAAPLITTIVDVFSLIVYFKVASFLLKL